MTLSLAQYESRALELCFAPEASDEALAEIGDPSRWRSYRNMVRARLRKVCGNALPRTNDAIGDERFDALFVAWLAEAPPKHRYFREVPLGFLEHATPTLRAAPEPWLLDLARYELTTWQVKYADDRDLPDVVDIDFERPIALNPALALLDTSYAVHQPVEGHAYPEESMRYGIYRAADFRAITMILTPMARALLEAWSDSGTSLTAHVQTVTKARGRTVDAGFIDGLSNMLADFIERGIVRGSLPPKTETK